MALGSTQPLTNEYQEYFLGVKAAGAVVVKSRNLSFVEPSGALPDCFTFTLTVLCCKYSTCTRTIQIQQGVCPLRTG